MSLDFRNLSATAKIGARIGWIAAVLLLVCAACRAQDADAKKNAGFSLELHANSHVIAADIGLPDYPGAAPYKNPDRDSNNDSVDLGFTFGDVHLTIKAAGYTTHDSAEQVLAFYRKPLSHYGQVLECKDGRAVGPLTVTDSGLTCSSDSHGGGNSSDHELRAGRPRRYRIVGIDDVHPGSTRFGLVYLELPRDSDRAGITK